MQHETIGGFLKKLAARVPAPGGGAVAALHAAQAAALLGMVARYSDGEKYVTNAAAIQAVLEETDRLAEQALQTADDDAAAFTRVADAYKLPRSSDAQKAARSAAIATALIGAAEPPVATIEIAGRLVELAETLVPIGNRNVITDIAAAAEAARAAATTARINVEVNLGGITDAEARTGFAAVAAEVDAIVVRAEKVTESVRREITA